MKSRLVRTRHGRLSVRDDDNGLPPVVLLHGLGGDHQQLLAFIPHPDRVGPAGVRRITIDMRGHGDTADLGESSTLNVEAFADDVLDVLTELQPSFAGGLASLIGISMGAEVALNVALRRPEIVDALILVRPSWSGTPGGSNAVTFPVLAHFLRTWAAAGEDRFAAEPAFQDIAAVSPAMAESMRKQFRRDRAVERAPVLEYVPKSPRVTSIVEMGRIANRTLVLGADEDPVHPIRHVSAIAEAIPGAVAVTLPVKRAEPGEHERALREHIASFLGGGRPA